MAIRNRKGQTLSADGSVASPPVAAPVAEPKKRGRPRKTESTKPRIDPALPTGAFHQTFPFHLQHSEKNGVRHCYFQCEAHMEIHIERYKLDRKTITISATEPRIN